ncbi:MAG TPA: ABC transporter permease [Ktedonobacterales bacterium]|nr:ABC transporter permease [Ktedonobacterales bacterium]
MEVINTPNVIGQTGPAAEELTPELTRKRRGQLRIIFDRFIRNRVAVAGLVVLFIIVMMAVFAPVLTHQTKTFDPANDPTPNQFLPVSLQHPLGTDQLGRDVFARMLFGAQVSLLVGAASMAVALFIGVTLGAVAGFFGGWVDNLLMRLVDSMLSVPYLLLLFVLSLTFSNGSVLAIVLLIAVLAWPGPARLVRGEVLALKEREFLLASRTLGAGNFRLMFRHILPNAAGPIIVNATLLVGANIITESVLSFFGFGIAPPQSSWGSLLDSARDFYFTDPLLLYIPGIAILITVLCFNLMGDGLRDALDPYMTER